VSRRAFTLLELILVLAVLGILASVVAARLSGLRGTQGVEIAARQVLEQAQRARHLAIHLAEPVRLRFDLAAPSVAVQIIRAGAATDPGDGGAATTALRNGSESLTATFVRDDRLAAAKTVDVVFWPDGRSDPAGTWTIATQGRSATVRIPAGAQPITLGIDHEATHAP
jgi:type II secretion system protein H